ncbi:MAG: hypothetical protein GX359_02975 [Clostridiales bacterium]|nr:hypothetical protein [Clostridiales bacterium]
MTYLIKKVFYPEIFQGKYKKKNYFEGWYFKIIDSTTEHALVIIPGISINQEDSHAFVQIMYRGEQVDYIRYKISDFWYSENRFEIMVGDNYFSRYQISLDLQGRKISIKGKLRFSNPITFPKTWYHPGIMGPFSYLPFMECYHGVVNIHHDIYGVLDINGKILDFQGGFGYIEKDWGRSFPKNWIWFQSNHFPAGKTTVMFSVANIPFLGTSFTGFLAIFRYDDHVLLFTTYTGARIGKLYWDDKSLFVSIQDLRFRLEMHVIYSDGGVLKAPLNGKMARTIKESIDSTVGVRLLTRRGKLLYVGTGTNTGFEIKE